MDDRARITHNPLGKTDSTMDPDTWKPVAPSNETSVVYEGPALLVPETFDQAAEEGANPLELVYFTLHLPLSAAIPMGGDDVEMLACRRDPAIVGVRFTVLRTNLSTYPISRSMRVQERASARPRAGR